MPLSHLNVLVAEDHPFQREHIVSSLQNMGITSVNTAEDGMIALAQINKQIEQGIRCDLVICDLQMPNMDGVAFIRHLAELQFKGSIIILSSLDTALVSSVTKMVHEYRLNFIGALEKPINTRLLVEMLREIEVLDVDVFNPMLPSGVSESDLINALNTGKLISYFQPKYRFSDRSIIGVEALARLVLEDGTIVGPDDFIYLYNKLGKTKEFELQVYTQAFHICKLWLDQGKPIQVSINFCANMLNDESFFDDVIRLARDSGLPFDLITVEVTERSLIKDIAKSIEFLARLRINGFNLAVDDFGTGYSSIKQLETLPFNELKIDRSFIQGIEKDKQKQAIVQSITELSKRMNLTIVAEGVETEHAFEIAKQFGCDICQGFLTGRPQNQEQVIDLPDRKN